MLYSCGCDAEKLLSSNLVGMDVLEEPSSEIGGTTRCVCMAAGIGTLILATSPTCLRRPRDEEEHLSLGSNERRHLGDCGCCLEPQREREAVWWVMLDRSGRLMGSGCLLLAGWSGGELALSMKRHIFMHGSTRRKKGLNCS